MTSAAEAEIGALFLNSRQVIPARRLLEEMDHRQPPTSVQIDNTTAFGCVNKIMVPKATKSTDMRYWYMRDQSDQEMFRYYWGKGKENCADYWTKHFSAAHHKEKKNAEQFSLDSRGSIIEIVKGTKSSSVSN